MIESILEWLQSLPPGGVYAALWFTAYIENLFPPSPSDVVMLFMATLVGVGTIGFTEAVGIATAGSVLGFTTAFWIGRRFGRRILESKRLPFLTEGAMSKVSVWFDRYGYGVIVANRFLAGTRAVVSFFAGISRLKYPRTLLFASLSALAWNTLVIALGSFLGANWRDGIMYLERYGQIVMVLLVGLAVWFFIRWRKKRKARGS
jgi:membrane protein DedA with SNARE-associated domain